MGLGASAELTHRYTFEGNVNDTVGTAHAVESTGTYLESPQYTNVIPGNAVPGAPTQSMEVGMSLGSKKSGITLAKEVFSSGAGSYSLWLRPDTLTNGNYMLSHAVANGSKLTYSGGIRAVYNGFNPVGTTPVSAGEWIHAAVTWDTSVSNMSFYVNGSLAGSVNDLNEFGASGKIHVGSFSLWDTDEGYGNQYDGLIYDLQVYDDELSATNVMTLYHHPGYGLPPEPELAHRYLFDGNAQDAAGTMHGSLSAAGSGLEAPQFAADVPPGADRSIASRSIELGMTSNTASFVHYGNGAETKMYDGKTGSAACWFKADTFGPDRDLLSNVQAGDAGLLIKQTWGDSLFLKGAGGAIGTFFSGGVTTGAWHHLVLTWNDFTGSGSISLDGATESFSFTPGSLEDPARLMLGNFANNTNNLSTQFDGRFYDLQFYDGELSGAQIAALYGSPGHVHLVERELEPILVVLPHETVAASAVVTDSPYGADPAGVQDATDSIQAALDAVAAQGGGTVFVPEGIYRVDGNLVLDYGVTLQGAAGTFDGTVLLAYAGRGDTNAAPFITTAVGGDVGVIDLCVYYPEQNPSDIQPYPPTIQTGGRVTLRNLLLANSYFGIYCKKWQGISMTVLENVCGTVLGRGIYSTWSAEFSWMRDVEFSNAYWEQAVEMLDGVPMSEADREAVGSFTRQNLIGLELQRVDGIAMDGIRADDAMLPVLLQPNPDEPGKGTGCVVADWPEARVEVGSQAWYGRMHYGNVDHVPEAAGKQYTFAPVPQPARTDLFIDVTRNPYAAVGNGTTDDTFAIQQALDAAGAAGGGTVYLPQGVYKVSAPLTVPDGVELRGPAGTVQGRESHSICTLAATYGHDAANPLTDPALITLGNHAGVRGFSIFHPLQPYDVSRIKPYPFDIRGNGTGCWVVDMLLVNAWLGMDLASHQNDDFLVRGLWATPYTKGIDVGGGSAGGTLERLAFSVGPAAETFWYDGQRSDDARDTLFDYIKANSTFYSFGASTNLATWGLVGFQPQIQCHFYEQDGESTRNAEFWLSLFDVADSHSIKADQGADIHWYGLWATTWGYQNWLKVDPAFQGPMAVYGRSIHQPHQTSAFAFTDQQVQIFNEVALTDGKAASASRTDPGSSPAHAVDRNIRTCWEAPAGSVLDVDLGAVMDVDRFDVESDRFGDGSENITRAELHVSTNGVDFISVATNKAPASWWVPAPDGFKPYWLTMPVENTPARYVRLVAECPAGTLKVAGFNVFNTSSAVRPVSAFSPDSPGTLQWASWPGHAYSVWRTDSLTNDFVEIESGIGGTGATLEFTDPDSHLHDAAFYRLKAWADE